MKSKSNLFLKTIILLALTLSSCTSNKSVIATAVAMTVQAQNTQLASVSVTDTPLALVTNLPLATIPTANTLAVNTPASLPALTPLATAQPATTSGTKCYANAPYVTDSPPDG